MQRFSARSPSAIPRLFALLLLATPIAAQSTCPNQSFDAFGAQGYAVRQVDLVGPLPAALNVLRPKLPQLASPVSSAAVESGKQAIREAIEHWPVLFDSPVAITLVSPDVVDCSNQAPLLLTVRYRFFTTKIPLAVSRTFEARSAAAADPGRALAARPERRLEITPNLGYNRAEQTFLGGRVAIAAPRYFNRIVAEGYASPRASRASVAAEGGTDRPEASIAHVDWRIGYQYADQPTNRGPMRDARLAAQLILTGKPNDASGVVWRYAASLEAGTQRSDFASPSRFGTLKQAVGITLNTWTQAFNLSYGLQLGRVPDSGVVSYSKHIADLAYDARFKAIQIESRFNAGVLLRHGPTPYNERFFGGGAQTPFLGSANWSIQANPIVRSIPNFWLNADRFAAYNLTAAAPVWRLPLVPREVRADPEIRDAITGLLNSAETLIAALERVKDTAHQALFVTREAFQSTIEAVGTRATVLGLGQCSDQADTLVAQIADLKRSTYWGPFLNPPSDPDDVTLPSLQAVCFTGTHDAEMLRLAADVEKHRLRILEQVSKIDLAKAMRVAQQQMAFPRRTVNTMIDDMDIFSISPVALADAARIGPRNYYAVGGGVRLTLASSVHFTLTYAYNPSRLPGDRPGALLISLGFANLFGKR